MNSKRQNFLFGSDILFPRPRYGEEDVKRVTKKEEWLPILKELIVSWHDFGKCILIRCQHLRNVLDNEILTTILAEEIYVSCRQLTRLIAVC